MAEGSDEHGLDLIHVPALQKRILVVRERHVMLDEDLAELYGSGNPSPHHRDRSAASASVYLRKTSSRLVPLFAAGLRAKRQ